MVRLFCGVFLAFSVSCAADSSPLVQEGAAAEVEAAAPDFVLQDTEGKSVRLSELRGKTVVLEWFNPDCPFVKYAYNQGPLKALPQSWMDKDVVWLAVNSGAPGKQGAGVERNKKARSQYQMPHRVLIDEGGEVGRAYSAKTTPQIVVIDGKGIVRYNGALDNQPLGRGKAGLQVYADQVLGAVTAGKPSPHSRTKPYGCSVKY
jgi:hypothetical protein